MQPIDFNHSIFNSEIVIPPAAKIVFVSDLFLQDYVGGAELTTEALIEECPVEIFKLRSKDVTMELLRQGHDRFWIFGNFCQLNAQLIPSIIGNMKYSVVEYDYKYCRARSPEKHFSVSGTPCDCAGQLNGKLISSFYQASLGLWWMSQKQKERYMTTFPQLLNNDSIVLSSVFSKRTLGLIKQLREASPPERKGWIVLGSKSWIKGADDAVQWCEANDKEHEVIWDLPYESLLAKLSVAEGFVYLPKGGDTCPRMVIEAKLLGCKLKLNDNVQHKDEEWFATDDLTSMEEYLFTAPGIFWNGIKKMMEYKPTISGYTTTYNAVKQQYPFEQCIRSMLAFCDEVCVVDGGSTDETWEKLIDLVMESKGVTLDSLSEIERSSTIESCKAGATSDDERIRIKQVPRDWSSKRHPVFDGMQKAEARAMCTSEYCWQMDSDEIVHEDDAPKVADLCRVIPKGADIMALPVIEYWGGPEKVRIDVQPWKWRLSRNLPHITHGIPRELRAHDENGDLCALEGTDGCDMIDKATGDRLLCINFFTSDVDNARRVALAGNEPARVEYERWFNDVVNNLPSVFHYSWYDLPRKIKLYRDYWANHWNALWNKDTSDTAQNNMMFDVPWSQVTDEMIESRAAQMKQALGGWIWHRKWDGETQTPHMTCTRTQPKVML